MKYCVRFSAYVALMVFAGMCSAFAGAWPQAEGHGIAIGSVGYLRANNHAGTPNPATGDGTFSRLDFGGYAEYGLTDDLTLGSIIHLDQLKLDLATGTQRAMGLSDLELFARHVLWRDNSSIVSAQGLVSIPTGYNPDTNPALGDNNVDLEPRLLFGHGLTLGEWQGFVELQAGYRFRLGTPADQLRLDATFGMHPSDGWMLLAQSFNIVSARNQGATGTDFDLSTLSLSAVRDVSPICSLQFGVTSEVAGRNFNRGNGIFAALWWRF